ncbi:Peroxisomal membrane protein PMP27 [Spathaspora sp. JA1]|nr:Peroxisomal membrane protein PMP27 [Spathaspora sp. JA1]
MVVDTLIYHPTLTKLVSFLDSAPQREKTLRLFAYLSRFLGYYALRKGYSKDTIEMYNTLKNQLSFIRKALRFFKPVKHLQTAAKAYDNKLLDPILQLTTIVRNLGYAGYLALDGVVLFKMIGLIDKKKYPTVAKTSAKFWMAGLIAGVINSLRIIYSLSSYRKQDTEKLSSEEVASISNKLFLAKRKLVWDLLDMFIAGNTLGVLHFTEGDVGLAGVITSLMGLRDMWSEQK